ALLLSEDHGTQATTGCAVSSGKNGHGKKEQGSCCCNQAISSHNFSLHKEVAVTVIFRSTTVLKYATSTGRENKRRSRQTRIECTECHSDCQSILDSGRLKSVFIPGNRGKAVTAEVRNNFFILVRMKDVAFHERNSQDSRV